MCIFISSTCFANVRPSALHIHAYMYKERRKGRGLRHCFFWSRSQCPCRRSDASERPYTQAVRTNGQRNCNVRAISHTSSFSLSFDVIRHSQFYYMRRNSRRSMGTHAQRAAAAAAVHLFLEQYLFGKCGTKAISPCRVYSV